jgi:hypothetical protein
MPLDIRLPRIPVPQLNAIMAVSPYRSSSASASGCAAGAATDSGFSDLVRAAEADDAVAGVVLSGSRARPGMATARSDHDVWVVTRDGRGTAIGGRRTPALDVVVLPLADFRTHGLPGSGSECNRYTFVHARVAVDTDDGLIARLVARKATLTPEEGAGQAAGFLDAFTNMTYRSLKNHRDGLPREGRLDAAEAAPFLLGHVFAMERRVRPFNKYLGWELARHPLADPGWHPDRLFPLLDALLSHGRPRTLRELFRQVETSARAAGHGAVLDAWGDDLPLLRGTGP